MLAEDEESIRKLVAGLLRSQGMEVLEAGSGEAAVRISDAHTGGIDLLVTDLRMPGMGGKALAEHLCALRPGVKVLYISGYSDHDLRELTPCGDAEISFLPKPFTPGELRKSVGRLFPS